LRTSSVTPKRGVSTPLRRPLRVSWKMKGSHMTGTPITYIVTLRATRKSFATRLISFAAK